MMRKVIPSKGTNTQPSATPTQRTLFLIALTLSFYGVAWMLQAHVLLNRDVAWLLEISARFLNGGKYVRDFFEIDPPGILYVYSPVIYLAKYFSFSYIVAFRIFVFLLATVSLGLNYYFLKKIVHENRYLLDIFMLSMTVIFLIFPIDEFGQKEHLLVLLSMPYIVHLVLLSQNPHYRINGFLNILIGVMAGVGFCIKPYFLIIPLILESHHAYTVKNCFAWIRLETGLIIIILITYCLVLLSFHQTYLTIEIPLMLHYFYPSIGAQTDDLLTNPIVLYFYFAVVLLVIQYRQVHYQSLAVILTLSLCGFFIAFLAQRTPWYYHLLPLLSVSTLLMVILANASVKLTTKHWVICGTSWIGVFVIYPNPGLFYPLILYGVFSWILGKLILKRPPTSRNNYTPIYGSLLLCFITDVVIYYQTGQTLDEGTLQILCFTLVVHSLILIGFLMQNLHHKKPISTLKTVYIVSLFIIPLYLILSLLSNVHRINHYHQKMIQFLNQHAYQKPVYFFSTGVQMHPFVSYSHAINATRFEHMVLLPELIKQNIKPHTNQQAAHDNDYFRSIVSEDLDHYRPYLVFINSIDYGMGSNNYQLDSNIDYIKYFSKDPKFKQLWQHYHFVKTLQEYITDKPLQCHVQIRQSSPRHTDYHRLPNLTFILDHPHKQWELTLYKNGAKVMPIQFSEVPGLVTAFKQFSNKNRDQLSKQEKMLLHQLIFKYCENLQFMYKFEVYQRDE